VAKAATSLKRVCAEAAGEVWVSMDLARCASRAGNLRMSGVLQFEDGNMSVRKIGAFSAGREGVDCILQPPLPIHRVYFHTARHVAFRAGGSFQCSEN